MSISHSNTTLFEAELMLGTIVLAACCTLLASDCFDWARLSVYRFTVKIIGRCFTSGASIALLILLVISRYGDTGNAGLFLPDVILHGVFTLNVCLI